MNELIIRDLEEDLMQRLRIQAARHGNSLEEECAFILRNALAMRTPEEEGLGSRINRRFAALGGLDLGLPKRDAVPRIPKP